MDSARSGLTLVEVIVSLAILSGALIGLYRLQLSAYSMANRSAASMAAADLASNLIKDWESRPPRLGQHQGVVTSLEFVSLRWRASVAPSSYSNLLVIELAINREGGTSEHLFAGVFLVAEEATGPGLGIDLPL